MLSLFTNHLDLKMIAIIGTSDQPCWLAEACKIFLLLFDTMPNEKLEKHAPACLLHCSDYDALNRC